MWALYANIYPDDTAGTNFWPLVDDVRGDKEIDAMTADDWLAVEKKVCPV